MSAMNLKIKRSTPQFSWKQVEKRMRVVAREVLREEIHSVHVDSRGYVVLPNEEEYAAYLKTQPDKLPSEIKALFIDPQGFRVHYSDYEPTPKKARELRERKRGRTVPHEIVRERLRALGVKV